MHLSSHDPLAILSRLVPSYSAIRRCDTVAQLETLLYGSYVYSVHSIGGLLYMLVSAMPC